MSFKTILSLCVAVFIGLTISPSYGGDLVVSGTIIGDELAIVSQDCTTFANGGKLTADIDGFVVCSDDDNYGSSISALAARMDAVEAKNTVLENKNTALEGLVSTLQSELAANTAADTSAHHTKYTDAESIAAVGPHSPDYSLLLANVSRGVDPNTSEDTLTFTNMNVQIVNGEGFTESINGTGNLIIGYNETREENPDYICQENGVGNEPYCNRRIGSHNVIGGMKNNYSAFGGMVFGLENAISGGFAAVTGGTTNNARGDISVVSGGKRNEALVLLTWLGGGHANKAQGEGSSISGGDGNFTSGQYASISGGQGNSAYGWLSSISGGNNNRTEGNRSSINGGGSNYAAGDDSSISGGLQNQTYIGSQFSSIGGGEGNITYSPRSSISGGQNNRANAMWSSVSGGLGRSAGDAAIGGQHDWVAGSLFEDN